MILVWSGLRQIGYRNKAREEASRGGSLAHRPDIDLATEVSKLNSQVHLKQRNSGTPKAVGQNSYWFTAAPDVFFLQDLINVESAQLTISCL